AGEREVVLPAAAPALRDLRDRAAGRAVRSEETDLERIAGAHVHALAHGVIAGVESRHLTESILLFGRAFPLPAISLDGCVIFRPGANVGTAAGVRRRRSQDPSLVRRQGAGG